jgi:hypothetical protein
MADKKRDDQLDPKAKGKKTSQADFDRNRDGLYGGPPKTRAKDAPGPQAKPPIRPADMAKTLGDFVLDDRNAIIARLCKPLAA